MYKDTQRKRTQASAIERCYTLCHSYDELPQHLQLYCNSDFCLNSVVEGITGSGSSPAALRLVGHAGKCSEVT